MEWVLASQSPRRKELLSGLGVKFRIQVAHTEEISNETAPRDIAIDLSLQKAQAVRPLEPEACIIAADTIVVLGSELLGKPASAEENVDFIRRLSGIEHEVMTGVTISTPHGDFSDVEITRVKFRNLSEQEIQWYAASGEGLDKAGAYGIQKLGSLLVESIHGDYFNVVGLPLVRLLQVSRKAGVPLLEGMGV